jgi:putative aldouronate transport system permease protein
MAAYVMTKKDFVLRVPILILFIIPMFIGGGLIPSYININNLKLRNNFLVYILPGGFSFYNLIIIRAYMLGLPKEVEESAFIDGAGFWTVLIRLIAPMSVPSIAAISLFTAVGQWNDWFTTMIYISDERLLTLQYLLQNILQEANRIREMMNSQLYQNLGLNMVESKVTFTPTSIRMAILMISTVPILAVYPFVQKYFTKGITLGAVKG